MPLDDRINVNEELAALQEAQRTTGGLHEAPARSESDQAILDAGFSHIYTLSSIESRLEETISLLEEQRTDLINDTDNWFSDAVRKQEYPVWLTSPSSRLGGFENAPLYANDINQADNSGQFDFRNIAINGVTYYTLRQDPNLDFIGNNPIGLPGNPTPLTAEGSDELRGLYNNIEEGVASRGGLVEQAQTSFESLVEAASVDPSVPQDIIASVEGLTNRQAELEGIPRRIGESGEQARVESLTSFDAQQLLRQALDARDLFYNHYVWVHYALQSQTATFEDAGLVDSHPIYGVDLVGPQLAQIFKDARVHQYLVASIEVRRLEEENARRLAEEASRYSEGSQYRELLETQAANIEAGLEGSLEEALEELVEAGAPGDELGLTTAELAQQRRLAEQTFLLDFLDIYARQNQLRNEKYLTDGGDPHFIMVHGPTDTIVNKLMYNPSLESLEDIKTSELSGLVPKIKLFKSTYLPTSDYLRGREIKHEIPFRAFIEQQEITDMLNNTFDRGQGVGIKRFEWRLEGRDPFAARRDIFGRLQIYFQSMDEFIRERNAPVPKYADNGEEYDPLRKKSPLQFRYVDLVNIGMAHPDRNFIWNPDYYKIEAEVGWHLPDGNGDQSTFLTDTTKEAIRASTMKLHLAAYDHDIDINDEGNVTLTIEYLAWQEGKYLGPGSDILSTPERRADRLHALKVLTDAQSSNCPDTYIADLQEAYKKKVRRQNVESWNRILNNLYEQDRVFYTKIDPNLLDTYLAGSRASAAQPLLQELGLRGSLENFDVLANSNINEGPTTEEIENRITTNIDGSNLSGSSGVLESLKGLSYNTDDDSYYLQFMYFGDLLETALDIIHTSVSPTESAYGELSKLEENTRIILGPISYKLNRKAEDNPEQYVEELVYDINIADIPISVPYFIDWFLTKIVAQERTVYPVLSFIREVSSDLIANAMREQGGERNVARQNLQLRTNFFTAGGTGREGGERLLSLRNAPRRDITELSPTTDSREIDRQTSYSRVDLDEIDPSQRPVLRPPQPQQQIYDYMLLYAINAGAVEDLDGDLNNDKLRGIYHFGIGRSSGIVRRIKFSKTDIPFMRESRLENEFLGQLTGLAVLANVYNATIECFGTTMFYPGMKIYINPIGLSPNFGSPTTAGSASSVLGIGGYHVITKVHSFIESGQYYTNITAIWESSGASVAELAESRLEASGEDCNVTRREVSSMIRSLR